MNTYRSGFADLIQAFVDYRNASGMSNEQCSFFSLRLFDKYCADNYPPETPLKQDMVDMWCAKRDTELNRSRNTRIRPIRAFIKFLRKRDLTDVTLPPLLKAEPWTYIPHVFTYEELRKFFDECDALPSNYESQRVRKLVCPVLFRLLYSSGIRTTEARLLRRENVDLEHGILSIEKSKGFDQHYVALHESMTELLRRYDLAIEAIQPQRTYFFEAPHGGCYTREWLTYAFRTIWDKANGPGSDAIPYAFRHNYAIENINRWKEDSFEFSDKLHYLSKSMGHRQIVSTLHYYSIVPRLADTIQIKTEKDFNFIVPEVDYEEDE